MVSDEATLRLCGPCRHFQMAFTGDHACQLGLPLVDGARHTGCASFDPFTRGEGSEFEQSDCCAQHAHGPEPDEVTPGTR